MKASDCKCCKCGKPAVAFWMMIPGLPCDPYCRECLDKAKAELYANLDSYNAYEISTNSEDKEDEKWKIE